MKKLAALLTALLVLLPGAAVAQTKTAVKAQAILAYAEDETLLVITDAKGNPLVAAEGLVLPAGAVIKTNDSAAEIQLKPNGTIIKLSRKTTFKIEALADKPGTGSNDFAVLGGKIRAVAAKLTGTNDAPGYNFRTPTANCGVRGTDFAIKFDPDNQMDWVCVQEGLVDFTSALTGTTVPVATAQFANTFDASFAAAPVDASRIAEIFADLDFVKLSPLDVPGKAVTETAQKAAEATGTAAADATQDAAAAVAANDPLTEFLKKILGLEVGSLTIDGVTYSQAVLSPTIGFDSFKLGLYLPIIYTRDLFDPSDWYHPKGNDEWSFGSDKTGLADKAADIATDLALKIKFLEWGVQGTDPFYLKVGNLKTMTIGHGTVVRNFANDLDFPSVRKIGLNAGAKFGGFTIEGLADDLTEPSVVGGRFGLDVVGDQVAIGVQTVADLHLADDQVNSASYYGDPILLVGGIDTQLFKIDAGALFRAKAFADVNALSAYFRSASAALNADEGLAVKTLWDGGLGSVGGEAGLLGNILIVDYRLSFQVERGLYKNAFFQGSYDRTRSTILDNLGTYLADPAAGNETLTMGVYGSAGFDLFGFVIFDGAYRWPFELKADGSLGPSDADYLKLSLELPYGKIPFIPMAASLSYERNGFVPSLLAGAADLFDAETTVKGEGSVEIAKGMDLTVGVGTKTDRDTDGHVRHDSHGHHRVSPSLTIGTKVHF